MKRLHLLILLSVCLFGVSCEDPNSRTDNDYSFINYQIENKLNEDISIDFYQLWYPHENNCTDTSLFVYNWLQDSIFDTYASVAVKSGDTEYLIYQGTTGIDCPQVLLSGRAEIRVGDSTIVHRRDYGLVNFCDSIYPMTDVTTLKLKDDKRRNCYTYKVTIDEEFLKNYPDNDYK